MDEITNNSEGSTLPSLPEPAKPRVLFPVVFTRPGVVQQSPINETPPVAIKDFRPAVTPVGVNSQQRQLEFDLNLNRNETAVNADSESERTDHPKDFTAMEDAEPSGKDWNESGDAQTSQGVQLTLPIFQSDDEEVNASAEKDQPSTPSIHSLTPKLTGPRLGAVVTG